VAGVPTVAKTRPACVPAITGTVIEAELAPKAWFAALTVTVSAIDVPPVTLYTTVKVPREPAATLGFVHCGGKPAHVHPAGGVMDTNVVFAGVFSVKVAGPVAATDPVLLTTCVKVRLLPTATGLGEAALVTANSA